jgi:hypothetical protein
VNANLNIADEVPMAFTYGRKERWFGVIGLRVVP